MNNEHPTEDMGIFLGWMVDTLARNEIIDLYFVVSDLVDIPISEEEHYATAHRDSLAMSALKLFGKLAFNTVALPLRVTGKIVKFGLTRRAGVVSQGVEVLPDGRHIIPDDQIHKYYRS